MLAITRSVNSIMGVTQQLLVSCFYKFFVSFYSQFTFESTVDCNFRPMLKAQRLLLTVTITLAKETFHSLKLFISVTLDLHSKPRKAWLLAPYDHEEHVRIIVDSKFYFSTYQKTFPPSGAVSVEASALFHARFMFFFCSAAVRSACTRYDAVFQCILI
jgi:hypothetical protein